MDKSDFTSLLIATKCDELYCLLNEYGDDFRRINADLKRNLENTLSEAIQTIRYEKGI